ncbi:MAG: T9SS type A sorting domain-containing protein [Candidatus Kapabacteria bacterium]|nr:T9SS type A sorting domain-containing protein [Candidatus Kapabacteria bacterium]
MSKFEFGLNIKNKYRLLILIILIILIITSANAAWERINSPVGGNIIQLLRKSDTTYAVVYPGGIFFNTLADTVWKPCTNANNPLKTTIAITSNNSYLFAITNNGNVYRSTNNGSNWELKFINNGKFNSLNKFISLNNNLYLCTDNGLFIGSDNANQWTESAFSGQPVNDLIEFNNGIYIANNNGIFFNDKINSNWTGKGFDKRPVYKLFTFNNKIYATTADTLRIYESSAGDFDWNIYKDAEFFGKQVFEFDQLNKELLISLISQNHILILSSPDDGKNWKSVLDTTTSSQFLSSGLTISLNDFILGTRFNGILKLNKVNSLSRYYSNVRLYGIQTLSMIANANNLIAGTLENGLFKSDNGGTSWRQIANYIKNNNGIFLTINNLIEVKDSIFASTSDGIFKTSDLGETWNQYYKPNLSNEDNFINLTFDQNRYFAIENVYNSSKKYINKSYTSIINNKRDSVLTIDFDNNQLYSILKDSIDIFIGSAFGIYKSSNGGNAWNNINPNIDSVRTLINYKKNIIAGSWTGVYSSSDKGQNWVSFDQGLIRKQSNSLYKMYSSLLNASSDGAYIKVSPDSLWQQINDGLYNFYLFGFTHSGNALYTYILGDGIYKTGFRGLFPIYISDFPYDILCGNLTFIIKFISDPKINFKPNNNFIAEISSPDGEFDSKTVQIGSTTDNSGTVRVNIPANLSPSANYRIRIRSTAPAVQGLDNLQNISFIGKANTAITGTDSVCSGSSASYTVQATTGYSIKWIAINGNIVGADNQTTATVNWLSPGSGTLAVLFQSIAECSDSNFKIVNIISSPSIPQITNSGDSLISSSLQGNQWFLDGALITGANSQVFIPLTGGNYTVQVTNNTGCKSQKSDIKFFDKENKYTYFKIDTISAASGDYTDIIIRMFKSKNFDSLNIDRIRAVLVFNANLLYPEGLPSGQYVDGYRYMNLDFPPTFIQNNVVQSIHVQAMLGNTDSTKIFLKNIQTIQANAKFLFLQDSGLFRLKEVCLDGGKRLIGKQRKTLSIRSINPNPAFDNIQVLYSVNQNVLINLKIINSNGELVRNCFTKQIKPGDYSTQISVESIANGTYYLYLESGDNRVISTLTISR